MPKTVGTLKEVINAPVRMGLLDGTRCLAAVILMNVN